MNNQPALTHACPQLPSDGLEGLVSRLAAAIWNRMIDHPNFEGVSYLDYANLYEIVELEMMAYYAREIGMALDKKITE